jgi:DNA-binding transcriptional regulator YiaG
MVLRRSRKEVVLAGFAAEAQAPMVVGDKTQLSTTACAAILQFSHETVLRWEVGHAMLSGARANMATNSVASSNFNSTSAVRLPATQRCASG